jgi:hypothetical protein
VFRLLGAADGPRPMMGESPSRLLAERLLVPRQWFTRDARSNGHDLIVLAEAYSTAPPEVVAWRLLDLPEPCVITVLDGDRVVRRRGNAWPIRKALAEPEKKCLDEVNRSGGSTTIRSAGWVVTGWAVGRGSGRRVVLRSIREEE